MSSRSAAQGYDYRWRRYARAYLAAHPLCAWCGEPARCVDHLRCVVGQDDPTFWLAENHQPLCLLCHRRKTAADRRQHLTRDHVRRPNPFEGLYG